MEPDELGTDMQAVFDTIISAIPAPACDTEAPLQILFSTIDYDDYVGRIGIGRMERGIARRNQMVTMCGGTANAVRTVKLSRLYRYEGSLRGRYSSRCGHCGSFYRRDRLRARMR